MERTLKVSTKVENLGQAFLELLSLRGIDYFFVNSGTGFASIEDAFVRRQEEGKNSPKPMLIPHEMVALCMAYGYYQITGRPQVAGVHVGVGTANGIGPLVAASRGRIPLLFCADRTAITEEGDPGSRNRFIHWSQEYFDQAGMLREHVKWEYELRRPAQLETVFDRALTMAISEPQGPVYLSFPREIISSPLDEVTFEANPRYDIPVFVPDPLKIQEASDILAQAEFPIIFTSSVGRNANAVEALIDIAETGAIGVISYNPEYMNFPTDHPYHLGFNTEPFLDKADVILMIECDVPWYPNIKKPDESTTIIQAGIDPFYSQYPIRSFPSDLTLQGNPSFLLTALSHRLSKHSGRDEKAIKARGNKLREMHDGMARRWEEEVRHTASDKPLDFVWVSHHLNRILDEDTILLNEYDMQLSQLKRTLPGTFFAQSHVGHLGWGLGALLGIKLAAQDKTVVAALGDGCYLFSVPSVCHYVSAHYQLPILVVIFNNQSYRAVQRGTRYVYPDGWASRANRFPLSDLSATANYEKICEAFGGYGERVEEPDQVGPALERALKVVREEKRQAVLNMICKQQVGNI